MSAPRRYRGVQYIVDRLLPRASSDEQAAFRQGFEDYDARGVYAPPKGALRWWYHRGSRYAEHLAYGRSRQTDAAAARLKRQEQRRSEGAAFREIGAQAWRRGASRHAPFIIHYQGQTLSSPRLRKLWLEGYDEARMAYLEGLKLR